MDPATANEARFHLDTQPIFNPERQRSVHRTGAPCGGANGGTGRFIPCCFTVPAECN
ncbi:MAG: hypothetical protein U0169_10155 [Polyangiaceae bacterium]